MPKQFLAVQMLTMLVALSAAAGGGGSSPSCTHVEEVLTSAPVQVYLPDGNTQQTVGEASIISRKSICNTGEFEVIDIRINLDDEIKPYGFKIKGSITAFETYASIDFRLKQLVNSAKSFDGNVYSKTKINHFGPVGILAFQIQEPPILFWMNTQSGMSSLINAVSDGQSATDRPLACSLDKAFLMLTKKATGTDGLKKDLQLTAIFRGPIQYCP